jgi:ribosomal protein L37AE/L43A
MMPRCPVCQRLLCRDPLTGVWSCLRCAEFDDVAPDPRPYIDEYDADELGLDPEERYDA